MTDTRQVLLEKVRFYLGLSTIYAFTLGFGWQLLQPRPFVAEARAITPAKPVVVEKPIILPVMGKPVRIVLPNSGIDLAVDEGFYNPADRSWTLSKNNAQYAMDSTLANDTTGNTLIYGHGTNAVFGRLNDVAPTIGAQALIYTDNGRVFSYKFTGMKSISPEDTSVFSYNGPAVLTIQTCSGPFSEWRSMFQFSFEKVVQ